MTHPFRSRLFLALVVVLFGSASLQAQQLQIPTLQVCNASAVTGSGVAFVKARADPASAGTVTFKIDVRCDPKAGDGYPVGALTLQFDLSDSVKGSMSAVTIEQVTSVGKHTPMVFLNGRCKMPGVVGCKYWLSVTDNQDPRAQGTPDIVSIVVLGSGGSKAAHFTGPVIKGDADVQ